MGSIYYLMISEVQQASIREAMLCCRSDKPFYAFTRTGSLPSCPKTEHDLESNGSHITSNENSTTYHHNPEGKLRYGRAARLSRDS